MHKETVCLCNLSTKWAPLGFAGLQCHYALAKWMSVKGAGKQLWRGLESRERAAAEAHINTAALFFPHTVLGFQYLTAYWCERQKKSCFLPDPLNVIYYLLFDLERNCTMSRTCTLCWVLRCSTRSLASTSSSIHAASSGQHCRQRQSHLLPDPCTMVQHHCNLGASRVPKCSKALRQKSSCSHKPLPASLSSPPAAEGAGELWRS